MRYSSLGSLDEKFRLTANNGEYSFRKISLAVPGEEISVDGHFCTPAGRSKYYYAVEYPKHRIVIHFTAGNIRSDMSALTRNEYHVSVAYVIARDGSIYQLFPSKYWSGHLGKGLGNMGTGNVEDKVTIGIELSNYGYLTEKEGNLETYYSRLKDSNGKPGPVDVYCSLAELAAYTKIKDPFRGQLYFATFSPAQYNSIIILLRYLTAVHKIPRQFLPEEKRYQTTQDILNFKGIVSHINYRVDGKWDIGPAFDWNTVIQGVQAGKYIPVSDRSLSPDLDERPPITSEQELEPILPQPEDPSRQDESYEEPTLS